MPIIKNFLYCLNSDNTPGKNNVMGVLSTISPEYIPGLFSFAVNFSILDLSEGQHTFSLKFKNPSGKIINEIPNQDITYEKDPSSNLPDEYLGLTIGVGMQNVELETSGLYCTDIFLDDKLLGSYDIYIKGKKELKESV